MGAAVTTGLPADGPFALLDDAQGVRLFTGLLASRELHTVADLAPTLATEQASTVWQVFALDYELGYSVEPHAGGLPAGQPLGQVWSFADCRQLSDAEAEALLSAAGQAAPAGGVAGPTGVAVEPAGVANLVPQLAEADYVAAVERIRAYIAAGDCYQVNFTFPLHFATYGDPLALYARLRHQQPTRHGGLLRLPGRTVLCLSPELFVEREGDDLVCRPMKGTAPRGATPAEDAQRQAALQVSEKDRAENVMIVDLLRNDLGRVAPPGAVRVDQLFAIETYPTLLQMTSTVRARAPGATPAAVLGALFPCGSITGAPKVRAMQIIRELEREPRGLYTGSLGFVGPEGRFRSNVAIRTLELAADGRGRMGVGSGIVIDSEPAREYAECLLKARFLSAGDPGFLLIETLRLDGGVYPRLAGHLARLTASAHSLGFACDPTAVRRALEQQGATAGAGVHRVRLTLSHAGALTITSAPFADRAGPWRLCLAAEPIDSRRLLQRHKTTARAVYDAALARVSGDPDVFDVLFLNERGEVAEGARSNVFVRLGGHWLTPPLGAGVLPGVLRGELLAAGTVTEGVISVEALRNAEEIRCGNALRGWWPVTLEE